MSDPRHELTCPRGHEFTVPADEISDDSVTCPDCGIHVPIADSRDTERVRPPASTRSLWAVMQAQEANSVTDSDPVESVSHEPEAVQAAEHRPRGLWAMIASNEETLEPDGEAATTHKGSEEQGHEDRAVDDETPRGTDDDIDDSDSEFDDASDLTDTDTSAHDGWELDDSETDIPASPVTDSDDSPPVTEADQEAALRKKRRALAALGIGVLALLLSGLNLLPWVWVRMPPIAAGIAALVLGYQALQRRRMSEPLSTPAVAISGMLLGVLAIFAGPMGLNRIGASYREDMIRRGVEQNLTALGGALQSYHDENGRYPPGGTYRVEADSEIPMHGWMTPLLPYVNESALSEQIDRTRPFDDPVNLELMRQIVPAFLAPHLTHEPSPRGLAVTHYAGVGGKTTTDQGLAHLGIFNRDQIVTRHDIRDGLSQTIIVGEITTALPPWGAPGNWRSIGRGLNRQISGFGNAERSGAHFLLADGSVRFFPNDTSTSVLLRLTTRDGGDHLPAHQLHNGRTDAE